MYAIDSHKAGWFLAALLLAASPAAPARQSDRNQPMDIDAGKAETALDDSAPTLLSGGVTIIQGTLHAQADQAQITVRGGEPSRVVLTGGPATLRQQMDDGTPMNAVAGRMDYDVTREVMVFTGNVRIEQPRGVLSGERVVYDMVSGQVTSGGTDAGRVKMRIMPRSGGQAGGATPAPDDAGNGNGSGGEG
ncbi:lipopolysaccharide transport periplasmic protein LptA [Lysobacter sp. GX 14042]|uniref:lipopolysaccharide transport periplasmic protein LptA n=1 Tax=Lysobacter sp. GX 14042 TaxID=2907155 RepID=UPI001F2DBD51|nr:lipopolysaccharide transport periplasmic protein LptA [Lysobacter sp. GX 14042]MCE7031858.1 lipopolysaccharide transport periplasmic protein LptA [Lysobacter sp. GX 14042]